MRWTRNLRLSWRALTRSWLRTALSIGGVAIGIASVVVLIGAGIGAERALRQALEPLGHNLLAVNTARRESNALRGTSQLDDSLRVSDWEAIAAEAAGVLRSAPIAESTMLVSAEGRTLAARITGTTPEFAQARNFPVVAGRFIDHDDLLDTRRVAVVGALVVEQLFEGELPLDEILLVNGVPFRIVGVTKKRGAAPNGVNEDELVIIPLTTAMRRLLDVDYLNLVWVQAESEASIPIARASISRLLRERHGISGDTPDDFSIQDQTAIVRAQQEVGGSLSRVVPGLSALTLGLGGIGLLAVSLLSVRERYAEIGLRLAVGGLPRDILLQFLTEAVIVSALGGLAGLALGAAGISLGASLTDWPMVLSWQAVVYPFSISVAIALVFGAYPALRAARLDPILALNSR